MLHYILLCDMKALLAVGLLFMLVCTSEVFSSLHGDLKDYFDHKLLAKKEFANQ